MRTIGRVWEYTICELAFLSLLTTLAVAAVCSIGCASDHWIHTWYPGRQSIGDSETWKKGIQERGLYGHAEGVFHYGDPKCDSAGRVAGVRGGDEAAR